MRPLAAGGIGCDMAAARRVLVLSLVGLLLSCKPQGKHEEGTTAGADKTEAGTASARPSLSSADQKRREARLKWNLATLVGDYEKKGVRDPKWNQDAITALKLLAKARAYGPQEVSGFPEDVGTASRAAVEAGCTDPLIRYVYARFGLPTRDTNEIAAFFKEVSWSLASSEYSSLRKFYGGLRAAEAQYRISGYFGSGNQGSVEAWKLFRFAHQQLDKFLTDKTAPVEEVDDACHEYFHLAGRITGDLQAVFGTTEAALLANWSKASVAHLIRGEFYVQYAWVNRGSGFANTVTPEGWKGFQERLAVGEEALAQAWKLNPQDARIANTMLDLELGQGKGRGRMEQWFQRAMDKHPDNYDACSKKLYYLEPKWYGSAEEMLRFGRECVDSETWIGYVPLVLREAHDSLAIYVEKDKRSAYWKQPEVWPDLKASFEKFFQLNPDATRWRHNYARYAYWCEQWDDLNEQLKLLGEINYEFFGGPDEFEKMAALAKKHERITAK